MSHPGRPLRRRGEAVRQAVLAATREEIAGHGIEGTTVAAVAARTGVHETSIYRRWGTRENLLVEALLPLSEVETPAIDTGTVREDLIALTELFNVYARTPDGNARLHAVTFSGDGTTKQSRQAFWTERITAWAPIVERAIQRGEVRPDTNAIMVIVALIAPMHMYVLVTGGPMPDALATILTDQILFGICPN